MNDIKKIIFSFLDQLSRRRWTALAVTWTVCVVGWLAVALMPDRYVSEARFHVDTTSLLTPLLKGISVNSDDQSRDRQVAIMQRTLTSRPNLLKVIQMTDADKPLRSETAMQDLISSLEKRISIKSQGTNLFQVQFNDNSPLMAQGVIQALLTIFVESSIGDKREDIQNARSFIDGQIIEYETQLKASEQRLAEFKIQNIQHLSSTSPNFGARVEVAQGVLKTTQFEYEDAVAQRDRLRQQLQATPQYLSIDAAPQIGVGGAISGSRPQRISALQARLEDMKLQLTERHPDVVNVQQALNRLREEQRLDNSEPGRSDEDALRSQIPNDLYNQLSLRLAEAEDRVSTGQRKLTEAESDYKVLQMRAGEAPIVEAQFTNLNRDYEVIRSSYDALLQRRESARIAAAADSTAEPIQFRMVAAPELPARPSGPNRQLFNALVFVFAFLAGGGSIFLLSKIDGRIVAAEDLLIFAESRVLGCVSALTVARERILLNRRPDKFVYALGSLALVFGVVLIGQPNFSELTHLTMSMS